MPNWSSGVIRVSGKPENVKKFCEQFVFEEEVERDIKKPKYFARSFVHTSWEAFQKEHNLGKATDVEFCADFAWSAYSCLIEGYPQEYKKTCITLKCACKKYNVRVEITTEEGGEGFEEIIIADKIDVMYDSKKMPQYKCLECGEIHLLTSDADLEDTECWECGKSNWELIKEN